MIFKNSIINYIIAIFFALSALTLLYFHIESLIVTINLFDEISTVEQLSFSKVFSEYYLDYINVILYACTSILLLRRNKNGFKYSIITSLFNLYLLFSRASFDSYDLIVYLFISVFTLITIFSILALINSKAKLFNRDLIVIVLLFVVVVFDFIN